MTNFIDQNKASELFAQLKTMFDTNNLCSEKATYMKEMVSKYGYYPCSFQTALEKLSTAEVLIGLEEKFKQNNIFQSETFTFTPDTISPVKRMGYNKPLWLQQEQLNIKLLNLSALGNANNDNPSIGKFEDWLKQILILPQGNPEFKLLGTVIYLTPFHPRDFGCAYLPTSKFVSPILEDSNLKERLDLSVEDQVSLFITFAQLAGHPVMYDVLPQTGRFSKTVLATPFVARWFDIKQINTLLKNDLNDISINLKYHYDSYRVDSAIKVVSESLDGQYIDYDHEIKYLVDSIEQILDEKRIYHSKNLTNKDNQEQLSNRITSIIKSELGKEDNHSLQEEDFGDKHGQVIGKLISEGLWPAPGGAWCSCGVPVYNKMASGATHPLFKHYDVDNIDVTSIANLDCQTPFYFVYLENGEYNQKVIDFWINFLKELQQRFNFDAYRIDHIDHVVDRVSQNSEGKPISYRVPAKVLNEAISELRKVVPHFGSLAEYMLWDGYLKEYHQDMSFDLLWGSDIIFQHAKTVKMIIEDSLRLSEYNHNLYDKSRPLSILKTYNNQDGEFSAIDQYPAQLGKEGALFKWFKFKFIPNASFAERPVLLVDGDESFTETGTEKVINSEIPLSRNNDIDFYNKFESINRFALHNYFCKAGISELLWMDEQSGLVSWCIKNKPELSDNERLFIVANENPPKLTIKTETERNVFQTIHKTFDELYNIKFSVPDGFKIVSEYVFTNEPEGLKEIFNIQNYNDGAVYFDVIRPSQFHIYKIIR